MPWPRRIISASASAMILSSATGWTMWAGIGVCRILARCRVNFLCNRHPSVIPGRALHQQCEGKGTQAGKHLHGARFLGPLPSHSLSLVLAGDDNKALIEFD